MKNYFFFFFLLSLSFCKQQSAKDSSDSSISKYSINPQNAADFFPDVCNFKFMLIIPIDDAMCSSCSEYSLKWASNYGKKTNYKIVIYRKSNKLLNEILIKKNINIDFLQNEHVEVNGNEKLLKTKKMLFRPLVLKCIHDVVNMTELTPVNIESVLKSL